MRSDSRRICRPTGRVWWRRLARRQDVDALLALRVALLGLLLLDMGDVLLVELDGSLLRSRRILVKASRARVNSDLALMRGLAPLVRSVLGLLLGPAGPSRGAGWQVRARRSECSTIVVRSVSF